MTVGHVMKGVMMPFVALPTMSVQVLAILQPQG
jgi:hypothetical protein